VISAPHFVHLAMTISKNLEYQSFPLDGKIMNKI
jgi:hypothetical protein